MKRIPKKQEETITRMKETRQIDDIQLREKITTKLEWIKVEIPKAEQAIKDHEKAIQEITYKILRMNGAEIILENILGKS
jgi:hypothetical protein